MNCPQCHVHVTGEGKSCPLCGTPLRGEELLPARYPAIPNRFNFTRRFVQLTAFLSLVAAVLCVFINYRVSGLLSWSVFVLLGIASFWGALFAVWRGSRSFVKTLMWQMFAIGVLSILWDAATGFRNWSLDYVLPILCAFVLISLMIYTKITKTSPSDSLIYLLICAMMGILMLVLLEFDIIHVRVPAYISGALSTISLLSLLIFDGRFIIAELWRRLHL